MSVILARLVHKGRAFAGYAGVFGSSNFRQHAEFTIGAGVASCVWEFRAGF
jgi:hypothetical protein